MGDVFAPTFSNLEYLMRYFQRFSGNIYSNYASFLPLLRGQRVIDMGCGYGYLTALVSTVADRVDGYDVDPAAVAYATKHIVGLCQPSRISFNTYNGDSTGVQSGSYDTVLSFEVIEHATEPLAYLRECRRVLKAEGRLYLSTPNGLIARKDPTLIKYHSRTHLTEFYPTEIEEMANRCGFTVLSWLRKVNTRTDEFRSPRKGRFRRAKVSIVGRLKSADVTYSILRWLVRPLQALGPIGSDDWRDYASYSTAREDIDATNCDTILLAACPS